MKRLLPLAVDLSGVSMSVKLQLLPRCDGDQRVRQNDHRHRLCVPVLSGVCV